MQLPGSATRWHKWWNVNRIGGTKCSRNVVHDDLCIGPVLFWEFKFCRPRIMAWTSWLMLLIPAFLVCDCIYLCSQDTMLTWQHSPSARMCLRSLLQGGNPKILSGHWDSCCVLLTSVHACLCTLLNAKFVSMLLREDPQKEREQIRTVLHLSVVVKHVQFKCSVI